MTCVYLDNKRLNDPLKQFSVTSKSEAVTNQTLLSHLRRQTKQSGMFKQ